MKKLITLTLIAISTFVVQAQNYLTDGLFGNNGHIFAPPGGAGGTITNILIQPDGKILLCGSIYDIGLNSFYNIMFRTDACGRVDSSFGINGLVRHTFDQRNIGEYYTLQPDGKILVAGMQSDGNAGSQQFPFIGRYNNNGTVDSSFATNGTNKISNLGPGIFNYIYLTPDNKILVSGSPNFNNHMQMRFDSAGVVDATFGSGGVVQHIMPPGINNFHNFVTGMRSDNKFISACPSWLTSGTFAGLSCYDTLGVVDSTFGVDGYFVDNNFILYSYSTPRMLIQSDDKVILAKQNEAETEIRIARYTTNGSLDTTFGVSGYVLLSGFSGAGRLEYISKFPDDSFIIGFSGGGNPSQFIKYSANGIMDTTFSLDGSAFFQFPVSLEKATVGYAMSNDEFIMGAPMALKRYALVNAGPSITQNVDTLFANVNDPTATLQWYLDGISIGGATDTFYVTTQNGNYSIEVSNSLGCTGTDTLQVTNTGIAVQDLEDMVSFFPNPVNDFMSFENQVGKELALNIYDISGKLMLTTKINSGSGKIDLSFLTAGVYMVEVKNDVAVSKTRIIKQ